MSDFRVLTVFIPLLASTLQHAESPSIDRYVLACRPNMRSAVHPALIKSSQDTKLGQPRSEEPTPTKLNDQHDTHGMPVRAHYGLPRSPLRLAQRMHQNLPRASKTARYNHSRGLLY